MTDVRRNDKESRYELLLDARVVGVADYRVEGDTWVFPHTEIDPRLRGRGLGEELVKAALEDVRANGHRVKPLCWFVDQFIRENEEYADLVA